jgi:hypothetical protein
MGERGRGERGREGGSGVEWSHKQSGANTQECRKPCAWKQQKAKTAIDDHPMAWAKEAVLCCHAWVVCQNTKMNLVTMIPPPLKLKTLKESE